MKKFLLTLGVMALAATTSQAEELYKVTFDKDINQKALSDYTSTWTAKIGNNTWSLQNFNNNGNGDGKENTSNNQSPWTFVRCGRKSSNSLSDPHYASIVNSFAMSDEVSQIVLNAKKNKTGDNDKAYWIYLYVLDSQDADTTGATKYSIDQTKLTSSYGDITVDITPVKNKFFKLVLCMPKNSNNGWFELGSITYNGSKAAPAAVATPTFEMVRGEYGYNVEISCASEGAEIYYTYDGSDPSKESEKYTAPIECWCKTTYKAIAYVGEDASNVATFVADPPMIVGSFSGLSDFPDGTKLEIDGKITAIYSNTTKGELWVRDSMGSGMLLYGNYKDSYANGDSFNGLSGTYTVYKGLPEIKDYTLGEVTKGGDAVEPTEMDLSWVSNMWLCKYVKIANVNIAVEGSNYTISQTIDGEAYSFALYNKYGVEVPTGDKCTVVGFISAYNDLQIIPISVEQEAAPIEVAAPTIELVAIPYNEDEGIGYEVRISCATEGAKIYYTMDEDGREADDPTNESTEYTGPIGVYTGTDFKAIAYVGESASAVTHQYCNTPFILTDFSALVDFPETVPVDIRENVTVVYQNGNYVYTTDGNNGMLLYGATEQKFNNGDTFKLVGQFTQYFGCPQITKYTVSDVTTGGTPVAPKVVNVTDVKGNMVNQYVKIQGVTISNRDESWYISDGNNEAILFNKFSNDIYDIVTVPTEAGKYDVTGFVTVYAANETDVVYQLIPVEFEKVAGAEKVATPVIYPEDGNISADTEISIICATEGAKIYYTLDMEEPDRYSIMYNAPFTISDSLTVKAFAECEGMEDSEIAVKEFTIKYSSIDMIEAEANGKALYFNLNGVRVENPANGVYVVVKAGKAEIVKL